jgi:hypothetical protein
MIPEHRGDNGFSSSVGLVAMAAGLIIVAVLLVMSLNVFGSGTAGPGGGGAANPSILSRSAAETQIKLCAEGRNSTYGDPPTPAQQATCVRHLLGQVSAGGPTGAGAP